jgi:hypothetical protein
VGLVLLYAGGDRPLGFGGQGRHGAGRPGATKAVVYNTVEEIEKFGEVLGKIKIAIIHTYG